MIPSEKHSKVMGGRDTLIRLRLNWNGVFSIDTRGKVELDVSSKNLVWGLTVFLKITMEPW